MELERVTKLLRHHKIKRIIISYEIKYFLRSINRDQTLFRPGQSLTR